MSVTYIRLQTEPQKSRNAEQQRWRELWEVNDVGGIPPLHRSLAIRAWALLKVEPRTLHEMSSTLGCTRARAYKSVYALRKHGQRIIFFNGKYRLLDGPPLSIVEGVRGLMLAPNCIRKSDKERVHELE